MRDVYAGIDQLVLMECFAASTVCDPLEVSRSGFYAWRSGQESRRACGIASWSRGSARSFGVIGGVMEPGELRWNWHAKVCVRGGPSRQTAENQGFRAIQPNRTSPGRRRADTAWATTRTCWPTAEHRRG